MVDMISIFEANVLRAADRYGANADSELIDGAVRNSTCDQSADSIINKLATLLVLVLSWISIGVEDCKRVGQIHVCSIHSAINQMFTRLLDNKGIEIEPISGRASCFRALIECRHQG